MLFLRTGNELASTVLNLTINPLPSVIGRFRSLKYHTAIYWSKYLYWKHLIFSFQNFHCVFTSTVVGRLVCKHNILTNRRQYDT